ncbi:hypothetical protein TorRG33x02_292110 [Trema orientale]|uniref:Uncharacterized protein n=1 Tax=Trema orientale TaxID=63057 RepID=A0A2P5CAI2_TREOI|nr:hypothetical protein TorRG33x02_292110 [Trema orientale]
MGIMVERREESTGLNPERGAGDSEFSCHVTDPRSKRVIYHARNGSTLVRLLLYQLGKRLPAPELQQAHVQVVLGPLRVVLFEAVFEELEPYKAFAEGYWLVGDGLIRSSHVFAHFFDGGECDK